MFVVAGATGHVGSVVATQLLAAGKQVKVIVRDAAKGTAWSQKGAEVAVGTLEDRKFLTDALAGASGFFTLLPAPMDLPTADAFYAWQRETAAAIGQAVGEANVPLTVILSSIGADLDAANGPIKGLYHLEQALGRTRTKLVAIRAAMFMENIAGNLGAAKHAGIFPNMLPSADYPMPMIATVDIGKLAAERLLDPPAASQAIDLAGPAYSVRQQAKLLGAALGKTLDIVDVPEPGWIPAMLQAGMPQALAEIYAEMYHGFTSGAIQPKAAHKAVGTATLDTVIKTLVG